MLEPSCEGQSHPNLHHVRFFVLSTGKFQCFCFKIVVPKKVVPPHSPLGAQLLSI